MAHPPRGEVLGGIVLAWGAAPGNPPVAAGPVPLSLGLRLLVWGSPWNPPVAGYAFAWPAGRRVRLPRAVAPVVTAAVMPRPGMRGCLGPDTG